MFSFDDLMIPSDCFPQSSILFYSYIFSNLPLPMMMSFLKCEICSKAAIYKSYLSFDFTVMSWMNIHMCAYLS